MYFISSSHNSPPRWRFFKSELNSNEHLAKSTHNLDENRHTISAWAFQMKLTRDLGEIDTRSRLGQQTKTVPSKRIASTHIIDFYWSHHIQIEFVVPSGNALQTPKSIVRFQLQLSYLNGMHHACLPITPPKRNTIWADQRTCLLLSNLMELYKGSPRGGE